uniref:Cytochrome P450 n=1 Tax=Rhodonia placenta TaxID=104341 RepID=F1SYA6_9APHY|nr:cytochrome P450 [Postia placenta]
MTVPTLTTGNILLSFGVAALAVVSWKLVSILINIVLSPLRNIPGPPNSSWVYGNMKEIFKEEHTVMHEAWVATYGNTIKYKEWFSRNKLCTVDTRALNYILSHSNKYQKSSVARFILGEVLGDGLFVVEGEQHRKQRRIMNPGFGPSQIRELNEIFVEKAQKLCQVWRNEISKSGESARINVLNGLNKMTLDVIGLAGFNYDFDALNIDGKPNELNQAFSVMFRSLESFSMFSLLKAFIPALRLIPDSRSQRIANARKVMRRMGMKLITKKKSEILRLAADGEKEKGNLQSRDVLTLLIKANMATDLPESHRLSDEDVLAQVPTFLVAGHETSSNATAWCLYALTQAPEVQQKLREELWNIPTENPTMDELNELPYLDAVVRETMRVHAPIPSTVRVAMTDDAIPLDTPFVDVHGQVQDSIRVRKGDPIFIPILAMNRSKALWGEDAFEFKPERWESVPDAVQQIPGVWANQLSFLGGPRACIGYRFSVTEMKALIFALVRSFEFELAVPPEEVIKKSTPVQHPLVRSEMSKGGQLPLLIKPYHRI